MYIFSPGDNKDCCLDAVYLFLTECTLILPPCLSLSLSGSDSLLQGWGPAPPSDDIRGLEIAAALKLPVMRACCEACNPGRPLPAEGKREREGQMGLEERKKKQSDRGDNEVAVATSQRGSLARQPLRANITCRGGAKWESSNYVLSNLYVSCFRNV